MSVNVDEGDLLVRLRDGDETAFGSLVDAMHATLRRLAEVFVGRGAAAEDVIQDTWVGVLDGLSRFEGRSSLRTWIGSILVNRARTRRAPGSPRSFRPIEITRQWRSVFWPAPQHLI